MTVQILKHPLFIQAQNIADLTKPLRALDITYFSHIRVDNHDNITGICNNIGFAKNYLENKYYNADLHMAKNMKLEKYVLWDAFKQTGNTRKMHKIAWDFGVRHTFTIIEQNKTSKDYYHFATHLKDNWINQIYLNNLDLLNNFISYFKEQIGKSRSLVSAYDFKFRANENASGFLFKNASSMEKVKEKRTGFIEQLYGSKLISTSSTSMPASSAFIPFPIIKEKHILQHKDTQEFIAITPQLTICLHHVFQGYTSKEIARKMQISHRTVEHHILKLRNQLGCRNTRELIAYYSDYFKY